VRRDPPEVTGVCGPRGYVRIALIGPAYPYQGGGARHTTELARRLAAAGHNVIIESWRAAGAQTVDASEGEPYPRTYRRLAWNRPDGWLAAGRRLRSADLVVFALLTPAQVPSYLSVLAGLSLGPGRPRTVVICHHALPPDATLTRTLLSHVDTVIVHSAAQAAQARALAPDVPIVIARMPPHLPAAAPAHPAAPSHLAERTVDLAPGLRTRLLFFGVVRPGKGLDILLQALARTPEHVTLTVVGEFRDGPAGTRQLITALGLGTRVTLRPGYLPAHQIPALFAAADALVLPYREATGSQNVQLAFSYGVPVVATTAGALAEAVRNGVDGLTCAPGDVEDLARALNEIAVPETARRLRAGVRPVDPEPYWAAYLRALQADLRPHFSTLSCPDAHHPQDRGSLPPAGG
jgi:glycosyltransferase involved in cell wall biosynthesis